MIRAMVTAAHKAAEERKNMDGYAMAEEKQMAVPNRKVKKPGFIKRWLLKSVKEAVQQEREQERDVNVISPRNRGIVGLQAEPSRIDQPERALHFTVYVANGGRVVETRRVDRKTDRSTNGLYVITNDQDFGREIDKIISMESLRG